MNKPTTLRNVLTYCLTLLLASFSPALFAQPGNDDVCAALDITLDAPPLIVSNVGATVAPGEDTIAPLGGACDGQTTWCDGAGASSSIDNSIWFTFTSPSSGAVQISVCGSNFDTQLALYYVNNCATFVNSFN